MKTTRGIIVLAVMALTSVAAGCSAQIGMAETDGSDRQAPVYHGSVSLVKSYGSVAELETDADLLVEGVAGVSRVETVNDVPFTITELGVTASSDASFVGQTINIRQTGSADWLIEGVTDILRQSERYVLFVSAYRVGGVTRSSTQYVITGEQGGWRVTQQGALPIFDGAEAMSSPLTTQQVDKMMAETKSR
jgi:hypothetical protein